MQRHLQIARPPPQAGALRHPDAQAASEENPFRLSPGQKQGLLAMREAVWRAWFNKDHSRLEQMIPAEAIAINPNEENWEHRDETVSQAGGKI